MTLGQPLSTDSEWTFELLHTYDREIARIANSFKLDTYPNQVEVISAEQMLDAYSSVGMPIMYNHWTYGKQFLANHSRYQKGHMGLAYEIVINSSPCIAYLMEENTMPMQALVIAHACYGHNSFFKGNYLFRAWTDAESIVDYLMFAKKYIAQCEEKYGIEEVESTLDACHALMNQGVNRYKRPNPPSAEDERQKQKDREAYIQQSLNELWRTIPEDKHHTVQPEKRKKRFPEHPEENLLYFIEKNAPLLENWQREIVRIVRKIAQYFYPQRQTQVMNEGWATFWHYTLLQQLYKEGKVNDGFMLEFLHHHANVLFQPDFYDPRYTGINPYKLGFSMMQDIRRACEYPTKEDKQWFPDIAGSDWLKTLDFAMKSFKDESFIMQYLSPKVMRELRLFTILDDDKQPYLSIDAIHESAGYKEIREALSFQYDLGNNDPNIQVWNVDIEGSRSLTLRHFCHQRRQLDKDTGVKVVNYLNALWKFDVILESVDHHGKVVDTIYCKTALSEPRTA